MKLSRSFLLLASAVVLLLLAPVAEGKKKARKTWTEAELKALETEWESGDKEVDLMTAERLREKEMKAKPAGYVGRVDPFMLCACV